MRTTQLINELQRERKGYEARIAAIDQALEGLQTFKAINNGSMVPKVKDEGLPDDAGTKAAEKAAKKSGKGSKRPTPPEVPCPDCQRPTRKGAGMAAHRKEAHGWQKGWPLYEPLPEQKPVEVGL